MERNAPTIPTKADARTLTIQRRWLGAAAASVLLGTLVLAYTHLNGPICLSRTLLHIPCPGCGLTRSMVSIWRGHPILSLRYHPVGIPLFLACGWAVVRSILPTPFAGWAERIDAGFGRLSRPGSGTAIFAGLFVLWAIRLALWLTGSRVFLW